MPNLTDIEWAMNSITLPNAGTPNKEDPIQALKDNGFDQTDKPTASEENWWKNKVYEWIADLDSRTTAALSVETALDRAYPVGSMYFNATDGTNPATLLNFTSTWTRVGQGRVLIGEGQATDDRSEIRQFNIGEEGGEFQHVLTEDELASHQHYVANVSSGADTGIGPLDTVPNTTINFNEGGSRDYALEGVNAAADGGLSSTTGSNLPHNNVQPYLTVYIWQRTA